MGAAYCSGKLGAFEEWARRLDRRQIASFMDVTLRGGLIAARRVFEDMRTALPDCEIQALEKRFGAVATNLETGREVWLTAGSLHDALRASVALPGFLTPMLVNGRWLIDGGLVNPTPISLCRALGADKIIAVDLSRAINERHARSPSSVDAPLEPSEDPLTDAVPPDAKTIKYRLRELANEWIERVNTPPENIHHEAIPSIHDVLATSLNIMQNFISRSRMAGEPPDLLISPRLGDFRMLDFHRADVAIVEGYDATVNALDSSVLATLPPG